MPLISGIVVYILTWWVMFFCILPFNIESIQNPTDGAMPGAPVNPGLKRKVMITTLLSTLVWLTIYALVKSDLISFRVIADRMAM